MEIFLDVIMVILFFISATTAFFGPRKWLRIAAISSFFAGFLFPIDDVFTFDTFVVGVCFGVFWALLTTFSGYMVKRYTHPKYRK